ncbi:MAG: hypothetical protein QOF60_313 [Actinomycetota bacterium]|nr:hypothetical protein [Actinomycetota bacterium]
MDPALFEEVAAILPGLVPEELGPVRQRARRYGIKVWFGPPSKPIREHYEAQVIGAADVPEARILALEVGFHAEHTKEAENEAVLAALMAKERAWRKIVGREPVAGEFIGAAAHWRRISETWPDPDLGERGLAFEIAARLTDYVTGLEPVRRARTPAAAG